MYCLRLNKRKWSFASSLEEYSHSYDAANQLIRENLYYGSGNSNNATYTYTYDQWGNIQTKKQYAYTTGSLGTVQNTISYGYGNSQWGDQLTSYNGQSISYDSMGNPTSYLGANLTWRGKQLTGYSKTGTNVTYAYNEDGLRTQKNHNGTTTSYYYNGSVLIGMQKGSIVQRFSYDAQGKVVAVDYSENGGSSYITYYYLRNAQGDIVKLIDGNKSTMVEYTYDSWGKLISTTGSLATSLGSNQPFRYRGYVYDTETQWYYLQSRYYDPNTCRFISSDVYLSTGQGVIGHNSYAYCLNNPVNGHDSNGEAFKPNDYSQECTDSGRGNRYKPWCFSLRHNDLVKLLEEKYYIMRVMLLSKLQHGQRDSGLRHLTDEEIIEGARNKNLPPEVRKRYITEGKMRGLRNRKKRESHYSRDYYYQPNQLETGIVFFLIPLAELIGKGRSGGLNGYGGGGLGGVWGPAPGLTNPLFSFSDMLR